MKGWLETALGLSVDSSSHTLGPLSKRQVDDSGSLQFLGFLSWPTAW